MNKDILAQKEADVKALTEKMENASSVVMVEYRGLTVKELTELRRALRAEDVDFKVYKNTTARRAAENLGYDKFAETLKGPNALAFGKDPVAPARVLAKFAKVHEKLILKTGIVDGEVVTEETIKTLSALPNKEGMLAKFASVLNAPVIKFFTLTFTIEPPRPITFWEYSTTLYGCPSSVINTFFFKSVGPYIYFSS